MSAHAPHWGSQTIIPSLPLMTPLWFLPLAYNTLTPSLAPGYPIILSDFKVHRDDQCNTLTP